MTELQVEKLVAPEMPIVVRSRVRDPRQPLDVRWAYPLLLCRFLSSFLFYGINSGDLWRTENLRALIAAEFLRSGDWIVPRLYGEPYLTKPPGMYAAIALASWPMGEVRTWSARLPSALAQRSPFSCSTGTSRACWAGAAAWRSARTAAVAHLARQSWCRGD